MVTKLLTCPRCSSSFRVSEDAIGDAGRDVRCSACAHEWLANRLDLRSDPADAQAHPPIAPLDVNDNVEDVLKTDIPQSNIFDADDTFAGDFADMSFYAANDTKTDVVTHIKQREKTTLLLLNTASMLCFVMAMMLCVIVFRQTITATFPLAETFYRAINFHDTRDIQLANLEFSRSDASNVARYSIKGDIVNHGKEAAPIPAIRARLFTKNGEMLKEWVLSRPDILPAGERRAFNAKNLKSAYQSAYMLAVEIGSPTELLLRE